MTIEVNGFQERDKSAAGEAALTGAQFAARDGYTTVEAFTVGVHTAQYATEVTLTALRHMGLLTCDVDIDTEHFKRAVESIADISLNFPKTSSR